MSIILFHNIVLRLVHISILLLYQSKLSFSFSIITNSNNSINKNIISKRCGIFKQPIRKSYNYFYHLKSQISDEEDIQIKIPSDLSQQQQQKQSLASLDENIGSTKVTKTTINDRLLAEVQREVDKTKSGGSGRGVSYASEKSGSSSNDKKKRFEFRYGPEKSEEERIAALQEAKNLNGIDPWTTILTSFFAFGMAFGIWTFTNYLGGVFASHPITTDVYFLERIQNVFRNLIMGLFSLMSGFFGVNGLGILLLGIRVAYGVLNGELDPTLNSRADKERELAAKSVNFSNIWEFMTMDKRNRIGKKNPFDEL